MEPIAARAAGRVSPKERSSQRFPETREGGLGGGTSSPVTNKPDLTERICQAIREVKLMREGKIKELSMDELLDEL